MIYPLLLATMLQAAARSPEALLTAFIQAFNTGNRQTLRAFTTQNLDTPPGHPEMVDRFVNTQLTGFAQSGGYRVRKIVWSKPAAVEALVTANWTGAWYRLNLYETAKQPAYQEPAAPYRIAGFGVTDTVAPAELMEKRRLKDAEIRSKIGAMLDKLAQHGQFSGTVIVARHGVPIYTGAYGLANRTWNAPNRLDTRFNLASITKMFTAASIGQLVQAGKLRFDETVGEVIPDYPNPDVRKVTVAELLSHTSGLIGSQQQFEKYPLSPKVRTVAEMVKSFQTAPLSFPPGTKFDYSNAGFELLGLLVEHVSGQNYYRYLEDHVFAPSGMKDSGFLELDKDPPRVATGFVDGPAGERRDNIFDLGVIGSPAGGAYATAPDMVRFASALTSGKLVDRALLDRMWTADKQRPVRNESYGFGAELSSVNGRKVVSHGGGWMGVTNQFSMIPSLDEVIVVLCNIDNDPASINYRIQEMLTQSPTPAAMR